MVNFCAISHLSALLKMPQIASSSLLFLGKKYSLLFEQMQCPDYSRTNLGGSRSRVMKEERNSGSSRGGVEGVCSHRNATCLTY